MKTIMVIFGGGGHTKEMIHLSEKLKSHYDMEFVVKQDDDLARRNIDGKIFILRNPREMDDNIFKFFLKLVPHTFQAFSILSKSKAEAVVGNGPAIAVIPFFVGKFFFRKKIIFIESNARVKTKSLTGKLISWFADLVFVQWEPNKAFKNAIFAGRLE